MFDRFTYFNWLVIASVSGGFLGTLLSWLTNTICKKRTEHCDCWYIIDRLLVSIAMSLVAGGLVFGFSLFYTVSIEDNSIETTFLLSFLTLFFSGSIDTLLRLAKQASSILKGAIAKIRRSI